MPFRQSGVPVTISGDHTFTGDITFNADVDFGSASVQSLHLGDDDSISFGNTIAAPNARILWETADANANELILALPTGGATDVPVFAIGNTAAPSIVNADLGFFNGVTNPTLAVISTDNTHYLKWYSDGTDGYVNVNSGRIVLDSDSNIVNVPDDNSFTYGSSNDMTIIFETADANANEGLIALPERAGANVSVLAIGNKTAPSIINADLGFFDGADFANPTLAFISTDNTKYGYFQHDGTDFVYNNSSGVHRFKGTEVRLNGTIPLSFNTGGDFSFAYTAIGGVDTLSFTQGSAVAVYYADSLLAQANLVFANNLDALDQFIHTKAGGISTTGNGYDGGDLYWRMGDGSDAFATEGGNGGDGGDFIVETGAYGALDGGGADGTPGKFIIRQPAGTPGTDDMEMWNDGTDSIIATGNGNVKVDANLEVTGANFRGRTAVGAGDYNPSALTDDYIIAVDNTAAARAVTISTEDEATGSTANPRIFVIKDESGGAAANNITVTLESGGTIDGAANYVITNNYTSVTLYIDGTNAHII